MILNQLNNQEVGKTKTVDMTRYIACGVWLISFGINIYRLSRVKKQDPESTEKQDLILIRMALDVVLFALFLRRVSIYFWI